MPQINDPAELNRLFMEVGELIGSLAALHEKLDSRAIAAEKESDLVQAELRNVNRDLRELERKHDASVHLLSSDVAGLKKSQDLMAEALKDLQAPVKEIMTLRAHVIGALLILGPISAAALYFIPEMWRALWRLVDAMFRSRPQ